MSGDNFGVHRTAGTENRSLRRADLNSLAAMSEADIFDDLVHLNADEAQSLLMILERHGPGGRESTMKRLGLIFPIIALMASAAFAQEGPRALAGVGEDRDRPQAQLQNSIADLYLANFKERVGLSDDQFLRVRPMVRRFIENRFQVANQRRILEDRQVTTPESIERL